MERKQLKWENFKHLNKLLEEEREKARKTIDACQSIFLASANICKELDKDVVNFDDDSLGLSSIRLSNSVETVKLDVTITRELKRKYSQMYSGFQWSEPAARKIINNKQNYEEVKKVAFSFGYIKDVINPERIVKDYPNKPEEKYDIYRHFTVTGDARITFVDNKGFFALRSNGRPFPLTFKYLYDSFGRGQEGVRGAVFEALLKDMEEFSYVGKDIVEEFKINRELPYYAPYTINDYLTHDNKIDFVRNREGLVSENDVKRFPVVFTSYLRAAKKLLMKRDYPKFRKYLKDSLNHKDFVYAQVKDVDDLLISYYLEEFADNDEGCGYWTVKDYIQMMKTLKKPISLSLSPKSLEKKHDEIVGEYNRYKAKKGINGRSNEVKVNKKFRGVKIEGFHQLDTVVDFIEEGMRQCNCVASYIDRVEHGQCTILSGEVDGTHYTIEIILDRDNQFKIVQMMKAYNVRPDKEHLEKFAKELVKVNKRRKIHDKRKSELEGGLATEIIEAGREYLPELTAEEVAMLAC